MVNIAFVLGNGVSRNFTTVKELQEFGTVYACNAIYRESSPDYLIAVNNNMICVAYFKALADETRVRLINVLLHHELSVNEIVALMDMGQSRISRHLKVMTDSGILNCRRDGAWAFYSAVTEGDAGRFIEGVSRLFKSEAMLLNE